MPSGSEVLGNGAIRGQKALGMTRRFKSLHAILTLPRGPMRVFAAVIEIAALAVLHARENLALGCAITFQLIRNDDPRYVLQPLEQLTKKLLCRLFVAAALHEDIEDVVVLVNRTPEVMALAIDGQKHFIQVPLVPWLGASVLQLIRVVLPEFQTPLADGLMGHVDATLEQDLFHVAIAQREAIVEPDPMADDLAGETVVFVACGISGWLHVWLPIRVFAWFLWVHHRREYLTGQEAGSTT